MKKLIIALMAALVIGVSVPAYANDYIWIKGLELDAPNIVRLFNDDWHLGGYASVIDDEISEVLKFSDESLYHAGIKITYSGCLFFCGKEE